MIRVLDRIRKNTEEEDALKQLLDDLQEKKKLQEDGIFRKRLR